MIVVHGLSLASGTCGSVHDGVVIVSLRKFQVAGASHVHLYEYGTDGNMIRQLTDDPGYDDFDPKFTECGQEVLFRRVASDTAHTETMWVADLETGRVTPCVAGAQPKAATTDSLVKYDCPDRATVQRSYRSASGLYSIRATSEDNGQGDADFKFQITDRSSGEAKRVDFTVNSGFMQGGEYTVFDCVPMFANDPFIVDPNSACVLVLQHHDSTDGTGILGFDVKEKRLKCLCENGGEVMRAPGFTGFFVMNCERYQDLGKTGKSVNCSYFEWCDDHLNKTRFGPPISDLHAASLRLGKPGSWRFYTYTNDDVGS